MAQWVILNHFASLEVEGVCSGKFISLCTNVSEMVKEMFKHGLSLFRKSHEKADYWVSRAIWDMEYSLYSLYSASKTKNDVSVMLALKLCFSNPT